MEFDNHRAAEWTAFKPLTAMRDICGWFKTRHRVLSKGNGGFWLIFALACLICLLPLPVQAQIAGLTQNDLGSTGATGTNSYSSGTYTIAGAGSGVGGPVDSFSYVNTATTGNIEIVARVASQTAVNNLSTAGLMMKDSVTASGAEVSIAISPVNGVIFTSRASASAKSITSLGTSVAAPLYLRLVRSGSSFAGYQSTDGLNWQQVGYTRISSFPSSYYVGFAVSSAVYGTLSTATFDNVTYFINVPQRNDPNLAINCWLRSDLGLTNASGSVPSWFDQSLYTVSGYQATGANQPGYVSNAIQSLPAASFDGSSQFFNLSKWQNGMVFGVCSFFVVTKPTGAPNTLNYWFDLGTSPPNNNVSLAAPNTTDMTYTTYNGSTPSSLTATSAITQNAYQLLEVIQDFGVTTMYIDGASVQSGSPAYAGGYLGGQQSCIGQQSGGGNWFQGEIAEVIVCNRPMTSGQRLAIEQYVRSKYGPPVGHARRLYRPGDTIIGTALKQRQQLKAVPTMPFWNTMAMVAEVEAVDIVANSEGSAEKPASVVPQKTTAPSKKRFSDVGRNLIAQAVVAPIVTPATGNYTTAQSVSMTAPAGSIYYTIDGTTPTNASTLYSSAFDLTVATQVKAVAYSGGNYSSVTTNWIEVDPSTVPVSTNGMSLWLRSDFGVTTSSSKIANWADLSGNAYDASQSVTANQPTLESNSINGYPAAKFTPGANGQFLQLPSGFSFANYFHCGYIFIVGRANAVTAGARIIDLGNGTASDNFTMQLPSSTGLSLYVFNGATSSNLAATSCIALGQDALLEGAATSFFSTQNISVNGIVQATGSLNALNNVTRANNFIGQGSGGGNYFQGDIAEVLVYNHNDIGVNKIESYFINKYQTLNVVTPAPLFSIATGTLAAPVQVALATQGNAVIRFTQDGSTPTMTSPLYTGPINVAYSQTIKAIAIGRTQSALSSATYTLDSTLWPAPNPSDTAAPTIQLQLPTPSL